MSALEKKTNTAIPMGFYFSFEFVPCVKFVDTFGFTYLFY